MNDFQMANLAASRSHDFHREAQQQRLASSAADGKKHERVHPHPGEGQRHTLRLTLSSLLGRSAA